MLQFGKVSDEAFTMDLAWPMTPLQARSRGCGANAAAACWIEGRCCCHQRPLPCSPATSWLHLVPYRVSLPAHAGFPILARMLAHTAYRRPPQAFAICLTSFDSKLACE